MSTTGMDSGEHDVPSGGRRPAASARDAARRRSLRGSGQEALDKGTAVAQRVKEGAAGDFWGRLNAVDFMNSAFQFATLAVLCLFPLLVVTTEATGRSVRHGIVVRMGLNAQATKDVENLITSGHQELTSLGVASIAFLALAAIGIASTLQQWYQRVYDQTPPKGWLKVLLGRLLWIIGFLLYIWIEVLIGQHVGPVGGHVLIYVLAFLVAALFWWWSAYVFLSGTVSWRELIPTGIATAVCVTGLAIFSALLFSKSIISDERDYGPVGVVMGILSYVIGFGVCLHLGAVFGRMWAERHPNGSKSVQPQTTLEQSEDVASHA